MSITHGKEPPWWPGEPAGYWTYEIDERVVRSVFVPDAALSPATTDATGREGDNATRRERLRGQWSAVSVVAPRGAIHLYREGPWALGI